MAKSKSEAENIFEQIARTSTELDRLRARQADMAQQAASANDQPPAPKTGPADPRFIAPDDPRLANFPAPAHGPGYLAKFGPQRDDDVFWVDPASGCRVHGDPDKARANVIAVLMEIDARALEQDAGGQRP